VIAAQAGFPLVRGIRSKPVTASAPDRMTPGAPGRCRTSAGLRGFALLPKIQAVVDFAGAVLGIWAKPLRLARAFPEIPIVLNHTAFRGTAARLVG